MNGTQYTLVHQCVNGAGSLQTHADHSSEQPVGCGVHIHIQRDDGNRDLLLITTPDPTPRPPLPSLPLSTACCFTGDRRSPLALNIQTGRNLCYQLLILLKISKKERSGRPCGPAAKNLPASAEDAGSIPGWRRSSRVSEQESHNY